MRQISSDFFRGVSKSAMLRRMSEVLQGEYFFILSDCICFCLQNGEERNCRIERLTEALWEQTCFLSRLTASLGGGFFKRAGAERGRLPTGPAQNTYLLRALLRLEAHCKRVLEACPSGVARAAFAFLLEGMQENITAWRASF